MPSALTALPRIAWDAYWRFVDDDGWAIASHIALSGLMSLFPFLIFVTSLAAFMGTQDLADEATNLILDAWPQQVAGRWPARSRTSCSTHAATSSPSAWCWRSISRRTGWRRCAWR